MPSDGHRPRKRFGQHFLAPPWAEKLVAAIAPRPDDTFLEIGPGQGALTRPLAARARRVVAVEIDRDLAAAWRAAPVANLAVIEGDFLSVEEARVAELLSSTGPVRVAANLPYNVASPILFRLTSLAPRLQITDATVMLQREVADRLLARPGSRDYGVLTILIGRHASIDRLFALPPGAFRPTPKVHSSVVRLRFHAPSPRVNDEPFFEHVVQATFTRRRKTLANALLAVGADAATVAKSLAELDLDGSRRPETLAIGEWAALADALARGLPQRG